MVAPPTYWISETHGWPAYDGQNDRFRRWVSIEYSPWRTDPWGVWGTNLLPSTSAYRRAIWTGAGSGRV